VARESFENAEPFLAFKVLEALRTRILSHEAFLELVGSSRAHPALFDAVASHARAQRREAHLVSRRRMLKEKEHRFFLGVLLNVLDPRRVLDLVHRAYPERPAVDSVVSWIREIAKLDAIHAWAYRTALPPGADFDVQSPPRVLDFEVDEPTLTVLRRLLEGGDEGSDARRAAELRASLVLGSLLLP
jgi:hypothetical protein